MDVLVESVLDGLIGDNGVLCLILDYIPVAGLFSISFFE